MKKALLLAVAFLVSIPLGLAAQSDTPPEGYNAASYARVTYVSGDVFVQRAGDLGTERVEVNLALVQGDKLGTGAGQVEVDFGRRNFLRMANNSKVEFAALPTQADARIKIHILEGSAYLRVSSLTEAKAVEVHSPDASFYILDEGLYRFDITADGQTEAIAVEGSLEAAGESGSVVVNGGESLMAADGRLLGDAGPFVSRSDPFDQWNASRDSLAAQRSTTRYLPSDIDEYQEELDQNGHWTYEQPYGYVWVPNGIADDWRPYMYGRWSYYDSCGWNWISSEPWGWPVYHYGRWHWRFGLGWYWIPQNIWGPAWVHWWWDNDYFGWCPLSWYNRPVVIVNNRFYDRWSDRDHFFPGNNRAMSVIRRDQLQAHDLGRRILRAGDLRGIDRVSLQARQPGVRPGIGRSSLQSPEAQRIFSARPGIRNEAKNYAPGNSVTSSRLRSGNAGAGRTGAVSRPAERGGAISGRSLGAGNGASRAAGAERSIRVYPRNPSSSSSSRGAAGNRAEGVTRSPRSAGSGAGQPSGQGYPSRTNNAGTSRQDNGRTVERQSNNQAGSSQSQARPGGRIKNYPSSARESSAALNPRSSSSGNSVRSGSSSSARTFPSRVSQGNGSAGSRQVQGYSSNRTRSSSSPSRSSSYNQAPRYNPRSYSYSRPSTPSTSRSNSSSYSRSGSPSYSGSSRSRSSYSSPSRSSGSSGRSYSAPRSSGSSSRGSYSAPSRSSGSSSSRSSSSRSSSRSSGSSGHSTSRRRG